MDKITLKWKKISSLAQIPVKATDGAAAFDLCAATEEPLLLKSNTVLAVPTGLCVEIPEGYEMQIRARSGLAFKQGIGLVNGVGTIDCDYRGELKILLIKWTAGDFSIQPGDRIAQALIAPVWQVEHLVSEELSSTERGAGGFGSTGVKSL